MAVNESLVFDGLELSPLSGTPYRLLNLDMPPPKKRYLWAEGGDADGAQLIRDPTHENRQITATIECASTVRDTALGQLGAVIDKLEEADKQPAGLNLVWTPSNGTKSVTFKVLSGEITELPLDATYAFGGLIRFTMVLTCEPFGYGTEVTGSATSSATPFVTVTVAGVTGDVPAEGRLIVTDAVTSPGQTRRYVEWGLEQRYYNAATSLIVESDNMVTTGFAGAGTTRTGAYDSNATGNNVIRATLNRGVVAVAGTGNLSHVGTFRVKARVFASSSTVSVRLAWQEGDGPFRANPYTVVPVAGAFAEVDLGLITIPPKDLGTQRWSGRVEAHSEVAGDTLDVNYLVLVPAGEGYGRVRGVGATPPATISGYDDFTTLAAAAALNLRAAPSGGSWATSGATTDFTGLAVGAQQTVARSTTADTGRRFAILGATNYTDTQVEMYGQTAGWSGAQIAMGVIARWVDASNYLQAQITSTLPATLNFTITQVVAGASTLLASGSFIPSPNTQYGIRLTAYATGTVVGELRANAPSYLGPTMTIRGNSATVATGGTLATGKPGFFDINSSGTVLTRFYDWFTASVPAAEPVAINATRSLEVRSDSTLRADSTNTYWGPVPSYRGSRFFIPPAGTANRTTRVLVKAHRQDIETGDAANVTDNTTAQIAYTPRYLVVPR